MKQSRLFTKTKKEIPKDEVSVNARLLIRAGLVDKLTGGVYSFLPLGFRVLKKIENIIREEMNAVGGQELLMPALHPKSVWETTGRWNTLDDLYKFKDLSGREFALGPTHEEVIVPLAQKYISSYKDLPFYAYQIQDKFRMELRAKSGILRGREFIMKDLYSFHLDQKDLDDYYEKVKQSYFKIFARLGIRKATYLTFASGGSFSKYSHEFQTLSEAGEDTIYICKKCSTAINKEIKEEVSRCPECQEDEFEIKKAIEVGNIFKLKDKYTRPFDLRVRNEKGESVLVIMGCYGIGLNRLMGTIVEICHDDNGIIWPESVAPFKAHLLLLGQEAEVKIQANKLYEETQKLGIEVLYDDRAETSTGEKFADSDLIGIPYRVVVSKKSLAAGGVEVKKRDGAKSEIVKVENLIKKLG